ncbi:FAD-dependent oxidoreductase [Bradyrhizobium zhanjiangense]|uniref:FAD-dependent oxidoreductase n=1 Tax=Bradyrhizobium zhanjiangense TaxID=1325107 RepID=UPI001FDFA910|nr:FAD-binding oxidoreductase [Bradyrhizobium zhanjiangense]
MNVLDEDTKSLWMETFIPAAARFSGQARADVGVVGAGIAGLSVAYELAARGRSVIVLDRGRIGCGMTARTTAHLATALDHDYKELIRVRGEDFARLYYRASPPPSIVRRRSSPRRELTAISAASTAIGYWRRRAAIAPGRGIRKLQKAVNPRRTLQRSDPNPRSCALASFSAAGSLSSDQISCRIGQSAASASSM